ncbi:MAG: ketoacyl-ACP synthase III [bacterium]|nr:ketoacyl-ACP synthase III [bacterium]MBU1918972.1 ketoacyl-ACP synthase III [bacterium]
MGILNVKLLSTSSCFKGRKVATAELVKKACPDREAKEIIEKVGIENRYWIDDETTLADLSAEALEIAIDESGIKKESIERVILATSMGADCLVPATVNAVLEKLNLPTTCDGFDLNNACMGYLTALDIASRSVATGSGPVAVVAAEISSRFLSPEASRSYLVMADGAIGTIVGRADDSSKILASCFGNNGNQRHTVTLAHPQLTTKQEYIHFNENNKEISELALSTLKNNVEAMLKETGLTPEDINWVVPHQPNGRIFNRLIDLLDFSEDKYVKIVDQYGSLGCASVACGFHFLRKEKKVQKGDKILMAGVGAGLSFGAMIYQV